MERENKSKEILKKNEKALMHMKLKFVQKGNPENIITQKRREIERERERARDKNYAQFQEEDEEKFSRFGRFSDNKNTTLADKKGKRILQRSSCEKLKIKIT